jgi:hypothetical protein
MKSQYSAIASWSTTANNQDVDNTPLEAAVLRQHLSDCKKPYGRFFGAVCAADDMHGFAVSRFVTTLFVVASLILVSSLVL